MPNIPTDQSNNMLKSIAIHGFRGFGKHTIVNFSIPNGKSGSGLNIIVGPNNSGKTTITEAISYYNARNFQNLSFSTGKRNIHTNNKVHIIYDNGYYRYTLETVPDGGSQVTITPKEVTIKGNPPFILQSRRYVDYKMNSPYGINRDNYSANQISNKKNRTPSIPFFEQRVFQWPKHRQKFNEILTKIITEPFNWIIDQDDDGMYFIKITFANGAISHAREGLGDGYWSIFTIVDALYDSKPGDLIVIDEPELSLHPSFQKRVLEVLEEYASNRQIIITTHSPYFISLQALINGGNLIRTVKISDGDIETHTINNADRVTINSLITDTCNPHILGLKAKELFFMEDNLIITEGQDDVILIPKVCKSLGLPLKASLFGWGAGGAEKIPKILEMIHNLGYKKVTAIFDGDKPELYKECKKKFSDYNIEIWPKDDIKDKPAHNATKEKEGMTDRHGNIKSENEESFRNIINSINKYHSI